jgi:hypothetical protein
MDEFHPQTMSGWFSVGNRIPLDPTFVRIDVIKKGLDLRPTLPARLFVPENQPIRQVIPPAPLGKIRIPHRPVTRFPFLAVALTPVQQLPVGATLSDPLP